MADNVVLSAGTGDGITAATDDVTDAGGAHYQRVKLTDGTANSETHIYSGNGTSTNALRVTVSSDSTGVLSVDDNGGSLTIDGTVTANLSATDNAVLDQLEINTSYGDQTGGGVEASALRVTLASDSTGVLSVDDNGSTLSVDDGAGSLTIDNAALSVVGGGVEATALRVTLASDSTGVLSIDDGGGALTVDGTVTANLSATDNAVLDQLELNTSYGDSVGGGTEAAALRVTIANDSTGVLSIDDNGGAITVDNGGTFATQSTLQTGSSLVGDVGISGARTSGGTTLYRNVDVDETEDAIKASAGQLYWIHAINLTAAVLYLQFYNATVASVTVGTTTPDLTFPIPTQGDTNGAGFVLAIPNGIAFSTAITIACTTTFGGASGPAANGCIVNAGYA